MCLLFIIILPPNYTTFYTYGFKNICEAYKFIAVVAVGIFQFDSSG